MTFLGDFSFFSALKKLSCCHDNYLKYHVWKIQWFGQHGEGFCMHVFSSTSLKKKKRWIMMGKHILNLYFKFVEEKNSHFVQPREFPCYRRLGRGSMLHSLINPPFCEYKFLLRQDRGTHSISIFSMIQWRPYWDDHHWSTVHFWHAARGYCNFWTVIAGKVHVFSKQKLAIYSSLSDNDNLI